MGRWGFRTWGHLGSGPRVGLTIGVLEVYPHCHSIRAQRGRARSALFSRVFFNLLNSFCVWRWGRYWRRWRGQLIKTRRYPPWSRDWQVRDVVHHWPGSLSGDRRLLSYSIKDQGAYMIFYFFIRCVIDHGTALGFKSRLVHWWWNKKIVQVVRLSVFDYPRFQECVGRKIYIELISVWHLSMMHLDFLNYVYICWWAARKKGFLWELLIINGPIHNYRTLTRPWPP